MNEKRRAYQAFFLKNEHGVAFMEQMLSLIEQQHEQAEKNPELARDFTQRAKGLRLAIEHIQATAAGRKPIEKG